MLYATHMHTHRQSPPRTYNNAHSDVTTLLPHPLPPVTHPYPAPTPHPPPSTTRTSSPTPTTSSTRLSVGRSLWGCACVHPVGVESTPPWDGDGLLTNGGIVCACEGVCECFLCVTMCASCVCCAYMFMDVCVCVLVCMSVVAECWPHMHVNVCVAWSPQIARTI